MKRYEEKYAEWAKKVTDPAVKADLCKLAGDEKAKENAFYADLKFGTAGMRGELGAGTDCLNVYTIRKVTRGVADCMAKKGYRTAAVSCDSRNCSDLFKRTVAEVFASRGIKTYVTRELMPTPFLSYLTRYVRADIGVMITASHNPAQYNGYKVYGSDGCQLTDAAALEMTDYIEKVDPFDVVTGAFDDYLAEGIIEYASDEITESFLSTVFALRNDTAEGLSVVYSPLNGTGYKLVPEILRRMNVKELTIVEEQSRPDGNFPTCPFPNPEKPAALKKGIEYAQKAGADILIATDPDCDRVGTAVADGGEYKLLTGNEMGVLLSDYLLRVRKEKGTLPPRPVIVKTIVTTELVRKIAAPYGVEIRDVLTGFKYIGDVIHKLEVKGEENRFILGFEESYGYLSGTYVRDKDAVNASMFIAEMAAYYKRRGKTLVARLNEIYAEYGLYEHRIISYEFAGADGNARMKELLSALREDLPAVIAGSKVVRTVDYLTQKEADLPPSNVLSFFMEDGSQVIVRPSGTEPLVKIYMTSAADRAANERKFAAIQGELDARFK